MNKIKKDRVYILAMLQLICEELEIEPKEIEEIAEEMVKRAEHFC
jgi:DNA-binding Xre family transcriptional regulator